MPAKPNFGLNRETEMNRVPRPSRVEPNQAGYTLVEVLTVCAIIGILAALSFPSLVQGLKNARRAKCANNLRQIGIAFASFAHDHNDRYPQQVSMADGGSRKQNLEAPVLNGQYILSPLAFRAAGEGLQTAQVMICPATKMWVPSFAALTLSNLCYALNLQAEPGDANITLATDSSLLGDWTKFAKSVVDKNSTEIGFAPGRHDNKGNVLFGDGHVELRKSTVSSPEALAAAARSVSSLNPPSPGHSGGPGASRAPTERERQAAHEAANPNHYGNTVAAIVVAPEPPPSGALEPVGVRKKSPAKAAKPAALLASVTATAADPVKVATISSGEVKLQRTALWLWLLLVAVGSFLVWRHFHRQRQQRAERARRWQEFAQEEAQDRADRLTPRTGNRSR